MLVPSMEQIDQALFQVRRLHLKDLPAIDIQGRIGSPGYLDFLAISDMPQGADLARFVDDRGRKGVAVRIQNVDASLDGIVAIFQRFPNDAVYVAGVGKQEKLNYDAMTSAYHTTHDREGLCDSCPTCPPFTMDAAGNGGARQMLLDLIKSEDLCFQLANANKAGLDSVSKTAHGDYLRERDKMYNAKMEAINRLKAEIGAKEKKRETRRRLLIRK